MYLNIFLTDIKVSLLFYIFKVHGLTYQQITCLGVTWTKVVCHNTCIITNEMKYYLLYPTRPDCEIRAIL